MGGQTDKFFVGSSGGWIRLDARCPQVRDCEFLNFSVWFRITDTPYKYPNDSRIFGLRPFVYPWYDMAKVGVRDFYPETWQQLHDPAVTDYEGKPPPFKNYENTPEYQQTVATYRPGSEPRWYEIHHANAGGSGVPKVSPHPGDKALKNTKKYGMDMDYVLQRQIRPSLLPSGTCYVLTDISQRMCDITDLYDSTTYEFQMQERCRKDYLDSNRFNVHPLTKFYTELGTVKATTKSVPLPTISFRVPKGNVKRKVAIIVMTYSEWLVPNTELFVDGSVYPWNGAGYTISMLSSSMGRQLVRGCR